MALEPSANNLICEYLGESVKTIIFIAHIYMEICISLLTNPFKALYASAWVDQLFEWVPGPTGYYYM